MRRERLNGPWGAPSGMARGEGLIVAYEPLKNRREGEPGRHTSNLKCEDGPMLRGRKGPNDQTAFLTSPDRRQRVHTRMRKAEPFTSAFTRCRLELKTRLVLLFAWLTLFPV